MTPDHLLWIENMAWVAGIPLAASLSVHLFRRRSPLKVFAFYLAVQALCSLIQFVIYRTDATDLYRSVGIVTGDLRTFLLPCVALEAAAAARGKRASGWAYAHVTIICGMILLSSGDAILFRMIAAGACVGYFAASLAWRRSSHSSILMLWCMALLLESGSIALGAGGTWQPGAISEFGQLACLLLWILLE